MSLRVLAAVVASFPLLIHSAAQPAGELSGSVRGPDGTPLPQMLLVLHGPSGSQRVVTGSQGRYRAAGLAPGEYTLSLDAAGFVVAPEPRVTVGDGPQQLDLTLSPAPLREHVVVSAARGEAALSTVGVTATVIDRDRIAAREAAVLLPLLQEVPGLATARTGGPGRQGSVFLRGGESRYARVLVDGVPVNEPGGYYDFGRAVPLELERVEVVRGAASSLYGTDALAGVVELVTRRAAPGDPARVQAEAEGGSLAFRRGQAGTNGSAGAFDWNLGLQRLVTDNEGENAAFHETAAVGALGYAPQPATSVRLTARFQDGETGTPGQVAFGQRELEERLERSDLVVGLAVRYGAARVLHELRAGYAATDQLTIDPVDSGPFLATGQGRTAPFSIPDFVNALGFQNDTRRLSLGYRLETQLGGRHLLTAGVDLERESGELGSRAEELLRPERTNTGAYLQDRVLLGGRVHLTAGARVEHNGSFGTRVVPRAALSWRVRGGDDATRLHASAGAGIKEPDFFQSFGVSFFARGNPDLEAERSRTYDLGLEQRLLNGRLRLEATAFHHDYFDQIAFVTLDFTTFEGSYVNLGQTRARGLELEMEAAPAAAVRLRGHYTLLDGEVIVSSSEFNPVYAAGQPLLRRPRHQGSFTAEVGDARASVAATLVAVGRRGDSDFAGLDLTENEGYARLDARARVRIAPSLFAFVVAENLQGREYQEALGYPALGRTLRVGLRWSGGRP
jgi:outer membrane cobalamin receptor